MSLQAVRRTGRLMVFLGAIVAAVMFTAGAGADDPTPACAATGVETVATDKGDYAPEETVHITGGGYASSCSVVVRVTRPDGSIVVGDGSFTPGSDSVTTSAGGDLAYDYQLDGILGGYLVEVLGAGGAVLASTTFTDALSLGQDDVDLSPAFTKKPTAATPAITTMSILVEQDSADTAIKCIRLEFPAGWTVNSATMSNVSAGTWSGTTSGTFAKFVSSGGLPGGSPGYARIEVNATTPPTDGFGPVVIMVSESEANAAANQICAGSAGKPPTQSIAIVWDDTWPYAPTRTYTADFRDAGGSVITPSAPIGVPTTYRMRFTLTGTTPNPDDAMSYATIALPPCFGSISVTSTTASAVVVKNWTGTVVDNTIRLRSNTVGDELKDNPPNPDEYVEVVFNATATSACSVGSSTWTTSAWGNGNFPTSSPFVSRVFASTGPPATVDVIGDIVPPTTTITLDPGSPDVCCWYVFPVKVTITATDGGTPPSGVAETRCVLDPTTPPATFDDLPASPPCPYLMGAWVFTDGVHTICAASRDNIGNKETPVCRTFKIDRTAPTSQVDPLPQFQPNPGPFTVSWSGMDNLSGIKDFDVRYRTASAGGSFGPYTQWFTDTTLTSASFTPTPGSTVCFSVRARDRACWEQPTYSPEVCTTAPYDDPSLTRTGYWSTVSGSGYFGPGVSRSSSPGNKLTLTGLRGSVIGVLATKQPGGGTIDLRWNGSTKLTTSLSAASVQKKQLLTFDAPQRPDRHARDRPDRLRHRRHRRRRRLQGQLTECSRPAAPGRPAAWLLRRRGGVGHQIAQPSPRHGSHKVV